MPKRRSEQLAHSERLRELLRKVAIDGEVAVRFDEQTVAGLGFTELEQRQLIAAYNIRTTREHYGGFPAVVSMETAERIWAEWTAEYDASMAEMLRSIRQDDSGSKPQGEQLPDAPRR